MQTKLTEIKPLKANELAKKQREISISEFFTKNRHLLGFDNPRKALLTTVKEAVDNSLDACDEARILPDVIVEIKQVSEDRFVVIVEDNGPGIIKQQIPKIFGKLLYGSKFHSMKQTRGQQGIGISASVMYGQLTTGKPAKITSKISKNKPAYHYHLHIDTQKNEPEITREIQIEWDKDQGTKIEIELEAKYQKGKQSVDEYLKQIAIANPYVSIAYTSPEKDKITFPRIINELPKEPKEIKPHPYGVELGAFIQMLKITKAKTLQGFLQQDFSRVSSKVAQEICENAKINFNLKPQEVTRDQAESLTKIIKETKIMAPPTDCLSPIGEEVIITGLKKEINADFYTAVTRPPFVYRGNPFQIEVGLVYGGEIRSDELITLARYANKVPLLYQQSACAVSKSVISTKWSSYGLSQGKGALPSGPCMLLVHMASVWVPFTSESKEAIAHYPEIIKEIKLALQEVGRKLSIFINKKKRSEYEEKKKSYIEKYIPHIAIGLKEILDLKEKDENELKILLQDILERSKK